MTTTVKTATRIKTIGRMRGDAALYRLEPPMAASSWDDGPAAPHEYVVVSAVHVPYVGGVETYLFAANAEGEITNWLELPGSLKNTLSHEEALSEAGYEIR